MSALTWKRTRCRYPDVCVGRCRTDGKSRGVGIYRAEILGYPAGAWCLRCRKEVDKAWTDALEPADVLEELAA